MAFLGKVSWGLFRIPTKRIPKIPGDSQRFLEICWDSWISQMKGIPRDRRRFPKKTIPWELDSLIFPVDRWGYILENISFRIMFENISLKIYIWRYIFENISFRIHLWEYIDRLIGPLFDISQRQKNRYTQRKLIIASIFIFSQASVSSTYPSQSEITVVHCRITVVHRRITVVNRKITVVYRSG